MDSLPVKYLQVETKQKILASLASLADQSLVLRNPASLTSKHVAWRGSPHDLSVFCGQLLFFFYAFSGNLDTASPFLGMGDRLSFHSSL